MIRYGLRVEGERGGRMPLHLIKLCVGCDSIEDLAAWQTERLKARRKAGEKKPQLFHRTFQTPKRRADLLAGGSLYWVIKGLVPVRPAPRRPFQGWRYLDPAEAPEDLKRGAAGDIVAMPPKLRKQLAELGLL